MSRCYRQLFILSPSCFSAFFFFNDPATTEIYTLSLHDALPISVTWDGLDVTGARADRLTRRGLNFVPQTANVFPSLTIGENVHVGSLVVAKAERGEAVERVRELFPLLRDRWRQRAGTLSGGQRKLLALARALVTSPRLL